MQSIFLYKYFYFLLLFFLSQFYYCHFPFVFDRLVDCLDIVQPLNRKLAKLINVRTCQDLAKKNNFLTTITVNR